MHKDMCSYPKINMKKKKVLIDVNSVVPYYVSGRLNGIGRTTMELVKALNDLDDLPVEIALYSQNMKGVGASSLQTRFKEHHLYFPHREKWDKLLAKTPVREWMTRYDLMHIPHNFEHVFAPEKCVVTLHDAFFMKIEEKAFGHAEMRQSVPPFIRKCRRVLTCSEYSKKDIVETMSVNPDKIDVIPWGIRHDEFFPAADKENIRRELQGRFNITAPYFLSVSCNAERKRSDVLIRSYIELSRSNIMLHDLVMVWGNPPGALIDEIQRGGCRTRIHLLSGVSDSDLRLLYQGAVAAFNPTSYEGFGLPVLEAMASGIPCVTCKNSSLPEVGGDVAIYLREPIEKGLLEVMLRFERGEVDVALLGMKGLERAKTFTWKKSAEQTVASYLKAIEYK